MKPIHKLVARNGLALVLLLPAWAAADEEASKAIHEIPLDERKVYNVPVSAGRVTTVSFPGPIAAIDAALVSTDDKTRGLFQLAHQPGTAFFSVRSLEKEASTNVNVRYNNRTYVLELKDSAAPVLSLVFRQPPDPRLAAAKRETPVTPITLLSALDLAKAYPALKGSKTGLVRDILYKDFRAKPPVMDHGDFQILLEEAFRFDAQDTLVFRVVFRNLSDRELRYDPGGLALRVGENRFTAAISDADGRMPAKGDAVAWFAVTGTPSGGRNDLSLDNDFVIVLEAVDASVPPGKEGSK